MERSRTDPNMLVITYTSEHNHPWPTQRNALAGSTRAQPSKNNGASKNSITCHSTQKAAGLKEENKDDMSLIASGSSTKTGGSVKEEMGDIEKQIEMDDSDQFSDGFSRSYKPAMPESNLPDDLLFADLEEIEADPLNNLLFTHHGFSSGDHEERESKALDPFSLFDWTGNNSNTSYGEDKRGL